MAALKVLGIIVACLCALAFVFGVLASSYPDLAVFARHDLRIRVFSACGVVVGFLMFAIGAYYVSTVKRTTAKTAGVWCSCTLVAAVTAAVAWTALGDAKAASTREAAKFTKIQVDKIAKEYFPRWVAENVMANTDKGCPDNLLAVGRAVDASFTDEDFNDAWGRPLRFLCGPGALPPGAPGIVVWSLGEDGEDGTPDDVRSFRR